MIDLSCIIQALMIALVRFDYEAHNRFCETAQCKSIVGDELIIRIRIIVFSFHSIIYLHSCSTDNKS